MCLLHVITIQDSFNVMNICGSGVRYSSSQVGGINHNHQLSQDGGWSMLLSRARIFLAITSQGYVYMTTMQPKTEKVFPCI